MLPDLTVPSRRGLFLATAAVATLIVGALLWWALDQIRPLPPSHIVMTTGAEGSAYHAFAMQYKALLATHGIAVELRPSAGDVENLARLQDPASGVDVGFLQGGLTTPDSSPGLASLGTVFYQPLWIFYRGKGQTPAKFFSEFGRHRTSVGQVGSGTRALTLRLFAGAGIDTSTASWGDLTPEGAAEALMADRIDAAIILTGWDAPAVQQLLRAPGIAILPLERVDAFVALYPFLDKVELPEGTGDLATDNPPQDVALLADKTSLVIRRSLHPAIQHLLLDAAEQIHARPAVFSAAGQFPAPEAIDLALSAEARHYFKAGRPFLQRHMPFWVAAFVERVLVLLLPLLGLMVPIMRLARAAYAWSLRRRILGLYTELRLVEQEVGTHEPGPASTELIARLDRVERRAHDLRLPASYMPMLYTLRDHIAMVRRRIGEKIS